MNTYVIENEIFRASISKTGCELISVVRKEDGREYIWCGDPSSWKRHAPVLFPIVGRLKGDSYRYEGQEYHMTQHGFARDMNFELVEKSDTKIYMKLVETNETLKEYPFSFELCCGFELIGNQIKVLWKVRNTGCKEMFFSIGGHPAFACPPEKTSMAGNTITFNTQGETLKCGALNTDGLLKDDQYEIKLNQGAVKITTESFDNDAWIMEHHQAHEVSILENGQAFVTVAFEAPVFGIWAPAYKNVPFLCIEPWYGRTDRASFEGELNTREWGNFLGAGEVFDQTYDIYFR